MSWIISSDSLSKKVQSLNEDEKLQTLCVVNDFLRCSEITDGHIRAAGAKVNPKNQEIIGSCRLR